MSNVCEICIEPMTKSRKVICPFCEYTCCKTCYERFLTTSSKDPSCISCSRYFDREVLLQLCAKTFINNTYKRHREDVLCEREKSLMPSTQAYVDQEIGRRNNQKRVKILREESTLLKRRLSEIEAECYRLNRNSVPELQDRKQFMHKCSKPGCEGYLSSAWKCSICETYTCHHCNVNKGADKNADHVCDENDVKTFQLLQNDSKKCPGCTTYIFKVSGCDQMWCTSCHTVFSWRTGQKINGTIHNPHYYEYMRNRDDMQAGGRNLNDIPCGGLPNYREIYQALRMSSIDTESKDFYMRFHRVVVHMEHTERPRYPTEANPHANTDIRIRFMLGEIDELNFKRNIQQREKSFQKRRDIGYAIAMFCDTASDLMRQMVLNLEIAGPILQELQQLLHFYHSVVGKISKRYDCVIPKIYVDRDTGTVLMRRM